MSKIKIDAKRFDLIASQCNWSDKSISIVKSVFIDQLSHKEVAEKYEITPNHSWVLANRFSNKDEKIRAKENKLRTKDFMEREKPIFDYKEIKGFSTEIKSLEQSGYSVDQIVNFLKENNVNSTKDIIENYLKDQKK